MVNRCVIIANGEVGDYEWHQSIMREDDFIVCADGGTRHALALGLIPHVVLGDFDSLSEEMKSALANTRCQFYEHPSEKDMTDTELALQFCLAKSPKEIIFVGTLGTRYDHGLSNIFLLAKIPDGILGKVINEQNEIMLLKEKVSLHGAPGNFVSIVPISPQIKGVSTKGLKYLLQNATLELGTSRGVSNEMVADDAVIEIREGWALVIRAWDVPRDEGKCLP